MFTKVHHVAIICGDYEKSKKFYVDTLGLKIIEETYREERNSYKLDLAVGEHTRIELFTFSDAPERPSYPEARGLRHIAFEVLDLDKAVNHLAERGVSSIEDVRVDELTMKRFTFFSDPDGLPIELYEK